MNQEPNNEFNGHQGIIILQTIKMEMLIILIIFQIQTNKAI